MNEPKRDRPGMLTTCQHAVAGRATFGCDVPASSEGGPRRTGRPVQDSVLDLEAAVLELFLGALAAVLLDDPAVEQMD